MRKRSYTVMLPLMMVILFSAGAFAETFSNQWSEPQRFVHNCREPVEVGTERMPWLYGERLYYVHYFYDIYYVDWDDTLGMWSDCQPVPGHVNSDQNEINPVVIRGGTVMYFGRYTSDRNYEFMRSEWDETNQEWGEPVLVEELSTTGQDWKLWIDEDETVAYIITSGTYGDQAKIGSGRNIWKSVRVDGVWQVPVNVGEPLNYLGDVWSIFVGSDGAIYIDSEARPGLENYGSYDIYRAADESSPLENIGAPFNSSGRESSISFNEKFFFFTTQNRPGTRGTWDLFWAMRVRD